MNEKETQQSTGVVSDLNNELELSAEELLRIVMYNFLVNHNGGIEWGIKEGYQLSDLVGADIEKN